MKTVIGIIIVLFILTGASFTVLAMWGIQPISWQTVWRAGATIGIIGGVAILLWFVNILFFRHNPSSKK